MPTMIELSRLILDWNIYPRTQVSDETVRRLVEAIQAKEKLPPIIVDKASLRVVDGFHRYHAYKRLGIKTIEVELREYEDEAALYAETGRLNARHGRPFSPQDCRRFVLKAEELGLTRDTVASILGVTREKVEKWYRETATNNGIIVPIKRGLETLRDKELTAKEKALNEKWGGMKAIFYINQLTAYIGAEAFGNDLKFIEAMDGLTKLWVQTRQNIAV